MIDFTEFALEWDTKDPHVNDRWCGHCKGWFPREQIDYDSDGQSYCLGCVKELTVPPQE